MSDTVATSPSTRRVSRTRGAASGVLLVLLGAWAALAPFIGPLFSFGFTPDKSWHWTAARGWYEVAPGAAIVLAGLVLLAGTSRVTTATAAWLAILAGGWLVCGPAVSGELSLGSLGTPLGDNGGVRAFERLAFFYLLGAVVIFLAAAAFGRLSVVTVRDVRVAEQREAARLEAEQAAEREALEREAVEREVQQRRAAEREAYERQTAEREAYERQTVGESSDNRDGAALGAGASANAHEAGSRDGHVTERPAGQARPYADDRADGPQPTGQEGDDQQGYDQLGYDQQGYDQLGYDQQGQWRSQEQQPRDQQQNWQAPPPQR